MNQKYFAFEPFTCLDKLESHSNGPANHFFCIWRPLGPQNTAIVLFYHLLISSNKHQALPNRLCSFWDIFTPQLVVTVCGPVRCCRCLPGCGFLSRNAGLDRAWHRSGWPEVSSISVNCPSIKSFLGPIVETEWE